MSESDSSNIKRLIMEAIDGKTSSLVTLFDIHRERLYRMIAMRLDPRLRSRVNPSDVLQEAFIDVERRLKEYTEEPTVSLYFWLRNITANQLQKLHRHHLDAQRRDAKRDISMDASVGGASSVYLASQLAASSVSIDRQLIQAEVEARLEAALDAMDERDREVIALRHFEELSTEEVAELLAITRSGVLKRYTRALRKLRTAIGSDIEFL